MDNTNTENTDPRAASNIKMVELKEKFEDVMSFEQLAYLTEYFPVGICVTDESGYFRQINPAYEKIYGYAKEELVGEHFTLVVPDGKKASLSQNHDLFFQDLFYLQDIWEVKHKQGHTFSILANAAPIHIDGKKFKLTFVVNISDLKATEQKLTTSIEQLQRRMEAMEGAQNIAYHDLRTSIGNIVDLSGLLLEDEPDPAEQREYLEIIHSLGFRTLSYLDMVSSQRHLEAGSYELKPEIFSLNKLLAAVRDDFEVALNRKQLALTPAINGNPLEEEDTVEVWGEENLFYFMLTNLLKNAIEASPKADSVKLEARVDDQQTTLTLSNRGAIPPEMRSSFFEKYATSGKKKGSGLGTYMARLVAEVHGGSITFVTSDEQNTTTITVSIPNCAR